MAATPFDIPAPGSSYAFDIYNDGAALQPTTPVPALPGGPCNYTDQSLPRCGCRRFWSRASLSHGSVFQDNVVSNQAEICMCSHHACFHEDVQPGQTQPAAAAAAVTGAAAGQENQRPRTNREPLSPVQGFASLHVPANLGTSLDFNLLDFHSSASAPRMEAANPPQIEDAHPGQDSPMPDTFTSWGEFARSQAGHASGLPPFPPQCLMSPPPPPSTACSSQGRYLRPFAGKGLQTLSGASALRPDARRPERIDEDAVEAVQTPAPAAPDADDTPKASPSQARSSSSSEGTYHRLADKVDTHEQRLDRLESNSFSVTGHDDCHDKHENVDLRVTELESRVDEVEKILNDNGSVASSRRTARQDGGADDATASVVSVSTNVTVRAEVYTQLQHLQAQVSQLQAAALPSYAQPWELEVVFLPFPLKGIWIDGREFAAQRRSVGSNAEDWTQMPNTLSRATPDPQSPKFQEWTGQGLESNWMLPKAFAAGRVIDQRLKSRGLIKTVLVRGADARSVQLAIHNAFSDVLRVSSNADVRSGFAPDYPLAEFLGLRQAWVPLRKLHKDSRLRFLSPSEMATPALWDFTFLVSSVVMKATGIQRLYITQPEAYLQDHPLGYHALEAGWTWQKLRLLSRVYPDSQSSTRDVPEADAMEECWNWNERLDEAPGANTSATSLRQSMQQRISRRSSTEPSQQFYTGVQSPILNSSSRSRAQSPLIQRQRKDSWPPHIRTGSLPPVGPGLMSPAQSRRRVSSHAASATPYERRPSPFVPRASPRPSPRLSASHHINIPSTSAAVAAGAKRRFTRSPSLVPRNTPRWSRTSMSRSPSLAPGGPYGFHEDNNNRERRTTPFYYATPHSEAVHEPYGGGYQRAGSRGPPTTAAMLRTNGYEPDDDEDEDMSFEDTDRGSETDPYDSEMTNADDGQGQRGGSGQRRHNNNGSFDFQTDGDGDEADLDIDVYEDEDEDELDGVDTDGGANHHRHSNNRHHQNSVWHGFGRQTTSPSEQQQAQQAQQPLRPEDIPWAGIEDAADADGDSNMSDGENVDPTSTASFSSSSRSHSQASSQQSQARQVEQHQGEDVLIQQGQITVDEDGEEDADERSSGSEAPSEYSSKPGAWQVVPPFGGVAAATTSKTITAGAGVGVQGLPQHQHQHQQSSTLMGFRIHEDGTATVGAEEVALAVEGGLLDTQWS